MLLGERCGGTLLLLVEKKVAGFQGDATVKEVADAACECLPVLRERIERETNARTLLRATSAEAPGEMLRAAQAESDTPKEQMLRAAEVNPP